MSLGAVVRVTRGSAERFWKTSAGTSRCRTQIVVPFQLLYRAPVLIYRNRMTRHHSNVTAVGALLFLVCCTAGAEARKVQMAVATFSQSVLPMVVAREKGYFREEDLDVELILMTASVANIALMGGNVDFISSGPSVVGAIARGAPLKFVFLCFNRPMHWLYARPEIKSLKDIKGKKIGVSSVGASAHFLVQEILRRHGMDPARDVTILGVGTTAHRFAALQSGTIDATNLTPPFNFKAQESGMRELVAYVKEDYLVEPAGAIVVRDQLFQSDPLLLQKFIRATLKGQLHIKHNRSGTIPILARLMKVPEEMAGKIYDLVLPGLTADGTITAEIQKKVLEFVFKVQGIKDPVAVEKVYDFAPVRKIRAELEAKKWQPAP
jgi:NitT/TauT family transport system substrate-binding protein